MMSLGCLGWRPSVLQTLQPCSSPILRGKLEFRLDGAGRRGKNNGPSERKEGRERGEGPSDSDSDSDSGSSSSSRHSGSSDDSGDSDAEREQGEETLLHLNYLW